MISVVIPVLNEEQEIGHALVALAEQRPTAAAEPGEFTFEVIVVDGGSTDRTVQTAIQHGARIVHTRPGRGRQMNEGAAVAQGDVLLFLHVDTRLPPGGLDAVAEIMTTTSAPGGGFLKRYDEQGSRLLSLLAITLNHLRSRTLRSLVGTQAIFVRRSVFDAMGGYRDWPLFEDVDLSDRLRQRGQPAIVPLTVVASARRYRSRGVLRQIVVNGIVLGLFRLGVGPARLSRIYQGLR